MSVTKVALRDISLVGISLDHYADLANLRKEYFKAVPEMCIERPRLITQFHLAKGLLTQDRISILDKATVYRRVLETRVPVVRHACAHDQNMDEFTLHDTSPFAGSTTCKFKGVLIYPELMGLVLWPELKSMSKRRPNPFHITAAEAEELSLTIFPHWMKKTLLEITRDRHYRVQFAGPLVKDYPDPMRLLQNMVFFLTTKPLGISHTIPDFSKVLRLGLAGIIREAEEKKNLTEDPSKDCFYSAVIEVLSGIITYSKRLAQEARRLAGLTGNSLDKARLDQIASIHEKVPESPATSFREALTTVWTCWIALHLENVNVGLSLGRLDQVLYPFYRKDIEKGSLTVHEAVELMGYLWLKIGDHVPTMYEAGEQLFGGTGSNQSVTVGGVDIHGQDAVNDLTYIILKTTELMQLRDPNLNARYHADKNPHNYLKRVAEVNINTGATPAIHNDKAVIKALVSKGDPLQDARDFGIVGCVEPVSSGRTYGHTASAFINLASALELALFNGKHRNTGAKQISPETGDPKGFTSFDQFWESFERQTRWLIDRATILNNQFGKTHQDFYPTPILSAFLDGPIDKGLDVTQSGASINSSGASIIGIADVVDSLVAVQEHVFNKKTISFSKLLDALSKDFVGYEDLHQRLKNPRKTPKYGNDSAKADVIAVRVVKMLDNAFGTKRNYRGGKYRVGYWTMTMHTGFGRLMRSLPNGRKAHEALASGITPVSGASLNFTSALHSVAGLPVEALANGVALNLKFTPEANLNNMRDNLAATVGAFFAGSRKNPDGGLEIQFNIVSRSVFEDARRHPSKYPELLVRVSGYTAYFTDLNPQMQAEIMERSEYGLSGGQARARAVNVL